MSPKSAGERQREPGRDGMDVAAEAASAVRMAGQGMAALMRINRLHGD